MQRPLKLNTDYSREEVHDIFDPDSTFTPQTGTWGLQGIVKVPERPGDYVFFVTYGSKQGEHAFDEEITPEGVLVWQSQPSQKFSSPVIQDFIKHDDSVNSIHLFLRQEKRGPYKYYGRLAYLSHDSEREEPVYFKWQILDWPLNNEEPLLAISRKTEGATEQKKDLLEEAPIPNVGASRKGASTKRFYEKRKQENHHSDDRDAQLGRAGEDLVLGYEKKRLIAAGRNDLAGKVIHVSVVEGDSAGYDICSWNLDETPKHIEVKTTRGADKTAFHVSINQVITSQRNPEAYCIYRVFEYDDASNSGKFFERTGPLDQMFELKPTKFRASVADTTLASNSSSDIVL
jgi:hypothetical protein